MTTHITRIVYQNTVPVRSYSEYVDDDYAAILIAAGNAILFGAALPGSPSVTPIYNAISDLPPAYVFGKGQCIVDGTTYFSNGVEWAIVDNNVAGGGFAMIKSKYSATQFTCNGLTSGTNVLLDQYTIPANTLGPNSVLKISGQYSFPGSSLNAKNPLIKIGLASDTFATATNLLNNQGFTTQKSCSFVMQMMNKGALNQNIWSPHQLLGFGINGASNLVDNSAIDFGQDITIYFGGTCSNAFGDANDIVRLEFFTFEVA